MSGRSKAQAQRPVGSESNEERAARLGREHALLEEGIKDISAGRSIEGEEASRWLKEWSTGGRADVDDSAAAPSDRSQ